MGRDRILWYCRDCWRQWLTDPTTWPPVRTDLCPYCRSDDMRWVPGEVSLTQAIWDDWRRPEGKHEFRAFALGLLA